MSNILIKDVERSLLVAVNHAAQLQNLTQREFILKTLREILGLGGGHEATDEEGAGSVEGVVQSGGASGVGSRGLATVSGGSGSRVRGSKVGEVAGQDSVPRGRKGRLTVEEFMKLSKSDRMRAKREGRYP